MENKRIKLIYWILAPILVFFMAIFYKVENIPKTIFIREGQKISSNFFIRIGERKDIQVANYNNKKQSAEDTKVSLLGMLPVKSISIKSVPEISVHLGGQPLGIKLNTKGVLVVALSDFDSEAGKVNSPAAAAGIQIGDSIIKIGKVIVNNAEDVAREINRSEGKKIELYIDRKGSQIVKEIQPIKSTTDGKYKIGLWIRDSTAGVGTMTFYDEKTKKIAALGHPITDVDTGVILKVNSGQFVSSSIISVKKGAKGAPGELRGIFVDEDNYIGTIEKNTECGIFGVCQEKGINKRYNKPVKIALRDEIKEGPAKILTTIEGEDAKLYDIVIEKLLSQQEPGPKSMVIRVTDPVLLQKTGGIVQGMSGSPIIQNDKLIGAVTHVLINKPDVGYGIYIEWMLKDADILNK